MHNTALIRYIRRKYYGKKFFISLWSAVFLHVADVKDYVEVSITSTENNCKYILARSIIFRFHISMDDHSGSSILETYII